MKKELRVTSRSMLPEEQKTVRAQKWQRAQNVLTGPLSGAWFLAPTEIEVDKTVFWLVELEKGEGEMELRIEAETGAVTTQVFKVKNGYNVIDQPFRISAGSRVSLQIKGAGSGLYSLLYRVV